MTRAPVRTPRSRGNAEAPDESDRFEGAPHPREVYELFGQQAAEETLLNAFREERLAQSWIIGGREGIGKATLAWRFARFLAAYPDPKLAEVQNATSLAIDPEHPAARRIAALSHGDLSVLRREWNSDTKRHYTEIRIDDARIIISRFQLAAAANGWRIAIIDCAEDMSRSTANALLKLIEEPPPRSLFMFIAHRPQQILATIRSRSRMLMLPPLNQDDVASAISNLGEPWQAMGSEEIGSAAARSGGSVRDGLRLLGNDGLKLMAQIDQLLERLPEIDWRKVQQLAESLNKRDAIADFEAAQATIYDWLDARVRKLSSQAGTGGSQLAPYAEVWEKFARSARETDTYNLDRRALILSLFTDLAAAVRLAA